MPPLARLVPDLGADVLGFVDFAVASLGQKSGIGIRVERQGPRRHHPRLHQDLGIIDCDFVPNLIALTRESLHHVHLVEWNCAPGRHISRTDSSSSRTILRPIWHCQLSGFRV